MRSLDLSSPLMVNSLSAVATYDTNQGAAQIFSTYECLSTQLTPGMELGIADEYHSQTPVQTPVETQLKTPPQIRKFNPRKSGYENVDKKRIEDIIKSLTENSKHHLRQKGKWVDRNVRHSEMKKKVEGIRACYDTIERGRYHVDHNIIPYLEFRRQKGHITVCVDFDCFYAAVEAMDNPSLVGKPHAVAMGDGEHSTLATTSYEARALGVKAGVGTFIGKAIFPELIIIPARMSRYTEISKLMEGVLQKYDQNYCMGSLDEAFLDITAYIKEGQSLDEVISNLRSDIKKATGLTVSAGCAPCLMIAKIAADMNKPDGQTILFPTKGETEREFAMKFMGSLPLIKVPGIGPVTECLLQKSFGFELVRDIYSYRATVCAALTPFKTNFLMRIVLGIGCPWTDKYYDKEFIRKGIGTGKTFDKTFDEITLRKRLRSISEQMEKEVEHTGAVGGRTLTIKLKMSDFYSVRLTKTLPAGSLVCKADDFEMYGLTFLERHFPVEIRKISFKIHNVVWIKRPRGSIKQYLKLVDETKRPANADDEFDEEWLENTLTKSQISQARLRAKKFHDDVYSKRADTGVIEFKKVEPSETRHKCPECDKCFKYEGSLTNHLKLCLGLEDVKEKKERKVKGKNTKISAYFKTIKTPVKESRGMKGNGERKRGRESEVDEKGSTSKRSKMNRVTISTLRCPVCEVSVFKYNHSLNAHIDACLKKEPKRAPVLLKLPLSKPSVPLRLALRSPAVMNLGHKQCGA